MYFIKDSYKIRRPIKPICKFLLKTLWSYFNILFYTHIVSRTNFRTKMCAKQRKATQSKWNLCNCIICHDTINVHFCSMILVEVFSNIKINRKGIFFQSINWGPKYLYFVENLYKIVVDMTKQLKSTCYTCKKYWVKIDFFCLIKNEDVFSLSKFM